MRLKIPGLPPVALPGVPMPNVLPGDDVPDKALGLLSTMLESPPAQLVGGLPGVGALAGAIPPLSQLPAPLRRARVPDDLDSVTRIAEEVDGASVGLPADGVDRIWTAVQRLYRWGMHPAIAICIRRDGEVVLDRSIGYARGGGPGEDPSVGGTVCTPETPFILASASKAVTAMVIHLLDQRGYLHVDDRVCDYVPEFGANGKQTITINHVLSHRSGVPNIPKEALDLDLLGDEEHILRILNETTPTMRPGRWIAYHAVSGGFILAEVVRRVTGKPISQVLEEEILEPLGFDWMRYGTTPDKFDQVATNHNTGLPVVPPLSQIFERALGLPLPEVTHVLDDPRFLGGVVPAANTVSTANELSRFYELLRAGGELDGVHVFTPKTIRRAVSEQSYMELDLTLGFPFRYGMGFMLGADLLSLYGPRTDHAFGHLGFTNIVGWADPERGISGALLTSGKPVVGPHLLDFWSLMNEIGKVVPTDRLASSPLTH